MYASTRRGNSKSDSWRLLLAKVGCAMARGNALVLRSARQALSLAVDGAAEGRDDFIEGRLIPDHDFKLLYLFTAYSIISLVSYHVLHAPFIYLIFI